MRNAILLLFLSALVVPLTAQDTPAKAVTTATEERARLVAAARAAPR